MIRNEPWETTDLRREIMDAHGCSKSQFDTALKNLQISLNVVRSNDPAIERDTWLPISGAVSRHLGAARCGGVSLPLAIARSS
jgi:hypothetical protein